MNNIVSSDIFDNRAVLAIPRSFRLLFSRRSFLALPYPQRILAFEQSAFLFEGRAFPCRLDTPKPGLSWSSRSDIRLASFGRGSGAGVVVSSQGPESDTDILFKRRYSCASGGRSPDHNIPRHRSDSAGP